MPTEPDMSAPVTRGEMHTALETWAGAIIDKLIAQFEPRFDAIHAKFDAIEARFADQTIRLSAEIGHAIRASELRMMDEMRTIASASEERVITRMTRMIDPFQALPARVTKLEEEELPKRVSRLEAEVFAPKRRAKAARRTRS